MGVPLLGGPKTHDSRTRSSPDEGKLVFGLNSIDQVSDGSAKQTLADAQKP